VRAPGAKQDERFQIVEATIDDVEAALRDKRITCRDLVSRYIRRIDAYDKAGPALNAVQTINPQAASEAARLNAAFAAAGPVGPLHCVPLLLKDQVETAGIPTTYGSIVFKDFVPARDATIVTKLKRAGAVIVAKTTILVFVLGQVVRNRTCLGSARQFSQSRPEAHAGR
jgi:Asp-tRNA(Asn)/Glu-tRNA(Gln) amidotransferase A subunit family amidase